MTQFYEVLQRAHLDRRFTEESFKTETKPSAGGLRCALPLPYRKEITGLVGKLFLGRDGPIVQTVGFAGTETDGRECSLVVQSADTLATLVAGRVCVVDANVLEPSAHQHFGLSNSRGLSNLVLESATSVNQVAQCVDQNLWLLAAGQAREPQRVFTSPDLSSRVSELRDAFDYLLIVMPPLGSCPEAITIARCTDGLVLVVRAHFSRRETALRMKESCESNKVSILGSVLTGRTFPIPQNIYSRL